MTELSDNPLRGLLNTSRPLVMGVLNITPDSFSDGGSLFQKGGLSTEQLDQRVQAMLTAGVDLFDIGGESTRPGAAPVSEQEEMARVLPAIERVQALTSTPISVDTSTPRLMKEAVARGVSMINDVRAFARPGAIEAVAASQVMLCVMHMQNQPATMQIAPNYTHVVDEVDQFFQTQLARLAASGIDSARVCLDPGFGFGKTLEHNLVLMRELHRFTRFGRPLLVGVSRKSMIEKLTGRPVEQRLAGSLALAQCAIERGANILRVHDVEATCDMIRCVTAVRGDKN